MKVLRVVLLGLVGCDGLPPCEGDEFVAMQSDFEDFASWRSFEVADPDPRLGNGARTVYVNALPPRGATVFPMCTMMVKVGESGPDPAGWLVVGMAKRGGGFNADGAVGWEWFDLDLVDGVPVVEARGTEGGGYRGELQPEEEGEVEDPADHAADCNACHGVAADNDYVLTPALQLSER